MPKINFTYLSKYSYDVCDRPKPASHYIPDWHKNMPNYSPTPTCPSGNKLSIVNGGSNATAKKCMPMLDSISSGYIVPLWADVLVEKTPNGPFINWTVDQHVFTVHGSSYQGMPSPAGFANIVFKYMTYFRMHTPPGYSVLVKPPSGHDNLPIQVVSAIVDTDKSIIDSNFPCWIRSDFEGVIKKGAPIAQVIPFKREDWKSDFSYVSEEEYQIQLNRGFLNTIKNNYVDRYWSRKKYE